MVKSLLDNINTRAKVDTFFFGESAKTLQKS